MKIERGDAMEKVGPLFLKFQYPPDYAIWPVVEL